MLNKRMVKFIATGHRNIKATHKTTLEFTKEKEVTPRGDCIVAVNTGFNIEELRPLLTKESITITITTPHNKETITAVPNPGFNNPQEMVIRITDFISSRTLATRANKSSISLNRNLVKELQNPDTQIKIKIE
jgi:uncharacterized protein